MTTEKRDAALEKLEAQNFDMVVIGGGITGSGVARDAALRGLKCLLLEKGDFASGTSSKSGKLIHGGLRYLKYFNFGLVVEASGERYNLYKYVAPHIVHPVRFLVPFYRESKNKRFMVAAGLFLYMFMAIRHGINRWWIKTANGLRKAEPHLRTQNCTGGLAFYDAACIDSRLVMDTLKDAEDNGAAVVNYCEVTAIDCEGNGVTLRAADRLSGREYLFRSRMALNAGGAWADDILEKCGGAEKFHVTMASGIHLVFSADALPVFHTLGLEAVADGRPLYVVPWDGSVIVGTTDTYYSGDKDRVPVERDSVNYLLETLDFYFPDLKLTADDVQSVYSGVRPLIVEGTIKSEDEMPRDDRTLIDRRGILSITGGKLTTYRKMAEKAVTQSVRVFFPDKKFAPCKTASPISGGDMRKVREILKGVDGFIGKEKAELFCRRYGSNAEAVIGYIKNDSALGEFISEDLPYCRAEFRYFVEREHCEKLSDLMFRRTQIYLFTKDNGLREARGIASYMGSLKGWDEERMDEETRTYREEVEFMFKELRAAKGSGSV